MKLLTTGGAVGLLSSSFLFGTEAGVVSVANDAAGLLASFILNFRNGDTFEFSEVPMFVVEAVAPVVPMLTGDAEVAMVFLAELLVCSAVESLAIGLDGCPPLSVGR